MKEFINYYEILGIKTFASNSEIIDAFEKKRKETLERKSSSIEFNQMFIWTIEDIRDTLLDKKKRIEYDKELKEYVIFDEPCDEELTTRKILEEQKNNEINKLNEYKKPQKMTFVQKVSEFLKLFLKVLYLLLGFLFLIFLIFRFTDLIGIIVLGIGDLMPEFITQSVILSIIFVMIAILLAIIIIIVTPVIALEIIVRSVRYIKKLFGKIGKKRKSSI